MSIFFKTNEWWVAATHWICGRAPFIILFTLFLLPTLSHSAEEYAKPRFYTQYLPSNFFDTQEAACSAGGQKAVENTGVLQSALVSYGGGGRTALGACNIKYTPFNPTGTGVTSGSISAQQVCPAGYGLGPSTPNIYQRLCTIASCPAGTTLNTTTNKCVDNCDQYKGQTASFTLNCGSSEPSKVCMPNNCAANVSSSFTARIGGCSYGTMTGLYTGIKCSGETSTASLSNPSNANPPPADSPETDCLKQGKSFGTVNGVPVCVPKTSSSATPTTTKVDKTTTTTNTDAAGNSTSSTTGESQVIKKDGENIVTTTTKTNADGSKTEETKSEPTLSFCATNPNSQYCKAQNEEEEEGIDCEENPDLPACMKAGQPTDTDVIGTATKSFSFTPMAMSSSAGCPADRVFVLSGRSFTVPFDKFCTLAGSLKPLILAFAYMTAAGIMFNGWKNS